MLTLTEAQAHLDRLVRKLNLRRPSVDKWDGYYRGEQPLQFMTDRSKEFLKKKNFDGFSDNWCRVVTDAPAERLEVLGFRLDDDASMSSEERRLWDSWRKNDLEIQSSQGFLESCIAGTSYVIVWGNESGEPVVSWQHPNECFVEYDPEFYNRRRFAVRAWSDKDLGMEYANLYTPTEVWKFERETSKIELPNAGSAINALGGSWTPRVVDGEPFPLPNPLGEVPVVEMPNRPMLGQKPVSEVAMATSAQDFLNLQWSLLYFSSETASLPQRFVLGAEIPQVPVFSDTGEVIDYRPINRDEMSEVMRSGASMWLQGTDGKHPTIDQWQAASPEWFLSTLNVVIKNLAAQTRTPAHYLVAELVNIAADALRASEAGLAAKVRESQTALTPAIREVFRLMTLVEGNTGLADAVALGRVVWRSAETRSEAQMVDAALKLQAIGMPFESIMEYIGKSPSEIEALKSMRKSDAQISLFDPMSNFS